MPKKLLVNKVKSWADGKNLDRQGFLGKVLSSASGKELSVDTILRVYDGDVKISMATASAIAQAIGVDSIAELFDIQ